MALSRLRKNLNIAFGLLFGVFLFWVFAPLLFAPVELWWFCRSIPPGASEVQIREIAAGAGYRVSSLNGGVATIYDVASLGRFTCALHISHQEVTSAAFELRPD